MSATLGPCNVTGFALTGAVGDRIPHLRGYAEAGSVVVEVETDGSSITPVSQRITPTQARAIARRLFALADEAAAPDLMDGPGREPLTDLVG